MTPVHNPTMDDEKMPSFTCPITQELMVEPMSAEDGHSYERAAIERWLEKNVTSPVTNLPLPTKRLTPNITLKKSIEEWKDLLVRKNELPAISPIRRNMCNGSSSTGTDVFVLKSTGAIVNTDWLFKNGFSRADCDTIPDIAHRTREKIHDKIARVKLLSAEACNTAAHVTEQTTAIEAKEVSLKEQVDSAMDDVLQQLTEAVNIRRSALHAQLSQPIDAHKSALASQLKRLHNQIRLCDDVQKRSAKVLTLGGEAIIRSEAEWHASTTDLNSFPQPQPMPALSISFDLHTSEVDQARSTVDNIGRIELDTPPPQLHGYIEGTPTYTCGTAIPPNIPVYEGVGVSFRMHTAIPPGLVLDPATGVLSGTPMWTYGYETGQMLLLDPFLSALKG